MQMKRIAITGSSGYLGSLLAGFWVSEGIEVLGLDIRPPSPGFAGRFRQIDIADPGIRGVIREFEPDTIVHGAFIVQPIRDGKEMERVNIDGSRNLLEALESNPPERLLLLSSATAYGAFPDNPVPLSEEAPLRARMSFPYAAQKVKVESMFSAFARSHPEVAVSILRPAIISGPGMENYLKRFLFGMRFLVNLDGFDQPLQFVHEEDMVGAVHRVLAADGRGVFNVGPEDSILVSEIARPSGRWVIPVPLWFARAVYQLGWTLRLPYPESPPGFLDFGRYPWIVDSRRLREELGFSFRYSSREALGSVGSVPPSRAAS